MRRFLREFGKTSAGVRKAQARRKARKAPEPSENPAFKPRSIDTSRRNVSVTIQKSILPAPTHKRSMLPARLMTNL